MSLSSGAINIPGSGSLNTKCKSLQNHIQYERQVIHSKKYLFIRTIASEVGFSRSQSGDWKGSHLTSLEEASISTTSPLSSTWGVAIFTSSFKPQTLRPGPEYENEFLSFWMTSSFFSNCCAHAQNKRLRNVLFLQSSSSRGELSLSLSFSFFFLFFGGFYFSLFSHYPPDL